MLKKFVTTPGVHPETLLVFVLFSPSHWDEEKRMRQDEHRERQRQQKQQRVADMDPPAIIGARKTTSEAIRQRRRTRREESLRPPHKKGSTGHEERLRGGGGWNVHVVIRTTDRPDEQSETRGTGRGRRKHLTRIPDLSVANRWRQTGRTGGGRVRGTALRARYTGSHQTDARITNRSLGKTKRQDKDDAV